MPFPEEKGADFKKNKIENQMDIVYSIKRMKKVK